MAFRDFSEQALARLIRATDPQRFDLDLKEDRDRLLREASQSIKSGGVDLENCNTLRIRSRICVSYEDFNSHLVLRAIVNHLLADFGSPRLVETPSFEGLSRPSPTVRLFTFLAETFHLFMNRYLCLT